MDSISSTDAITYVLACYNDCGISEHEIRHDAEKHFSPIYYSKKYTFSGELYVFMAGHI